jgi:hypothetical protein
MNAAADLLDAVKEVQGKRLANLGARCALVGVELYAIESDDGAPLYVGSKWALCRHMRHLDEVAAWIAQIDGKTE